MTFIELIHDEASFFRQMRIGRWIHVYDYETHQGKWYWEGEAKCLKTYTMSPNPFQQKRKPNSSKKNHVA